jgi:hypothetical protein
MGSEKHVVALRLVVHWASEMSILFLSCLHNSNFEMAMEPMADNTVVIVVVHRQQHVELALRIVMATWE